VDTLKSLAVITMLGAVLYGVYVVASKPDKPLPESIQSLVRAGTAHEESDPAAALAPPSIEVASEEAAPSVAAPRALPLSGKKAYSASDRWATSQAPNADRASAYETGTPEKSDVATRPPETSPIERIVYEQPAATADAQGSSATERLTTQAPPSSAKSSINGEDIEAAKQRLQRFAFQRAWKTAQEQVAAGRHREALIALSPFYKDPAIPSEEQEELVGWLDALAAKVIYSTEHLLEPAYAVRRNESLYSISERYHVPYLLLRNINGVRDPEVLLPGTSLKVVRGPFHAEVDLSEKELTLFVQNMYAGRFPFAMGNEQAAPGEYVVVAKDPAKSYASGQGVLGPKDPRNPYGGIYLDLGHGVAIHGSPSDAYAENSVGCISLAPRDAEDVFAILSKDESTVTIRP
jgi:LysM repeat protein